MEEVGEGVKLFTAIYDKMQSPTDQTQKGKLEMDLKTQIKKLQRLRDKIDIWIAGSIINHNVSLYQARMLIDLVSIVTPNSLRWHPVRGLDPALPDRRM